MDCVHQFPPEALRGERWFCTLCGIAADVGGPNAVRVPEWRVLSLSHPWPRVILPQPGDDFAPKDIENRGQRWKYRGNVLLHASRSFDKKAEVFLRARAPEVAERLAYLGWPRTYEGHVFARARIVELYEADWRSRTGVVAPEMVARLDKWHMEGQHAFVLEDVRRTPLVPCIGALGLFTPPDDVLGAALAEPCPNHRDVVLDYLPIQDCWQGCPICANST